MIKRTIKHNAKHMILADKVSTWWTYCLPVNVELKQAYGYIPPNLISGLTSSTLVPDLSGDSSFKQLSHMPSQPPYSNAFLRQESQGIYNWRYCKREVGFCEVDN